MMLKLIYEESIEQLCLLLPKALNIHFLIACGCKNVKLTMVKGQGGDGRKRRGEGNDLDRAIQKAVAR